MVHARTLEFGTDLQSEILMVPRGYERTGTTPDGKNGLKWKAKYASVGMNGASLPILFDGLNERGLAAGLFYFPTICRIHALYGPPMPARRSLSGRGLGYWKISPAFDEVKANIGNIVVPAVVFAAGMPHATRR